jgi:predicted RNase H-like nuclease (RuvC/YqgF family)
MSSPRFTIKKVSVEEQHEEYINEIKKLKKENETLSVENENLKKIIMKLTFQTAGITSSFLYSPKISEHWEHVDP